MGVFGKSFPNRRSEVKKRRFDNIFSKKYVFIPFGYNITENIAKINCRKE